MPDEPFAPQTPPSQPAAPLVTPSDAPLVTGPTSTGMAPNVAAGLAVLFSFVSGIIFLVIEKRSQYVRFWAMQSTIYGLAWVAVRIAFGIFVSIFSTSLDMLILLSRVWQIFSLLYLVGVIIMLYFAFTGKEWEMPVLGKFARQQLIKFPPKP